MKNKCLVLGQVLVLIIGVVTISWAVGDGIGFASAVVINGKNYNYGDYVTVTVTGGRTQSGYLSKSPSSEYPYALTKTQGSTDYVDFGLIKGDSVGYQPSTAEYFKTENIESISNKNLDSTAKDTVGATATPTNNILDANIPNQPTEGAIYIQNEDDPYGLEIEFQGVGSDNELQNQNSGADSDWAWYESILGRSGSNTYSLQGDKYKQYQGNNYYFEDGTLYAEKNGATRTVNKDSAEYTAVANDGQQHGRASVTDAGSYFIAAVAIAETSKSGVKAIANAVGVEDEQAETLGEGIRLGVYAGATVNTLMKFYDKGYSGSAGTYIGMAVAAWYILNEYKELEEESVTFDCSVYEAPSGGRNCERCNDNFFGCSEYQCNSLGKGCELLNVGTDEELCAWVNRNDASPPVISLWEDVLDRDYSYAEDGSQTPPDYGVLIYPKENEEGCVKAYTALEFGISLDEPATCKADLGRTESYDKMSYYFGSSSTAKYNHTHTMSLPSINANGTVIEEGVNMSLYVRCEDANGNSNTGEFVFKFCVEAGDDFTPPLVVNTEPVNGNPVAYNISQIDTTVYVNEEVDECKWDFTDKNFADMNFSMSCSNDNQVIDAQILFPCTTTITAVKDREENNYFIRCNDTSGNINKESYELVLVGTQPLYIDSVEPNDTIVKDSTSPVKVTLEVTTSSGTNGGEAYCYYKSSTDSSYVQFLYDPLEMNYQHTQELYFDEGIYDYNIRCVDAGGNAVHKNITFEVEEDLESPLIVRAYKEDGYLKLITDEDSECVYNNDKEIKCEYEFDDGISMQTVDDNEHFVEWNSKDTFYIKCKDLFGNPPLYDECSIVVRPTEGQTL
ncbi:MAG: hypothetical protein OQK82_05465 [Candidatus Pacearchaeota archaeon]|nr:hypothetical protein [Candidatus Pacearchaeota archaeon]